MERELTLGDIFEDIAERLALARTKALMGERQEALGLFQGASLDFTRFRDVLADYPGFYALEHAFDSTLTSLSGEQAHTGRNGVGIGTVRSRKRTRKAA